MTDINKGLFWSDWNDTRRDKSDTDLFYKEGWKVSIGDVETLKQWMVVNIPFPVKVTQEEKYRTNPKRHPFILSAENKYDLKKFLPLIKESFGMTHSYITDNGNNSFKVIIRKVILITIGEREKIINDYLGNQTLEFDSVDRFKKVETIAIHSRRGYPPRVDPELEKANDLAYIPQTLFDKIERGFWVPEEAFNEWLRDWNEAFKIYIQYVD